jgi:hypothetical protein
MTDKEMGRQKKNIVYGVINAPAEDGTFDSTAGPRPPPRPAGGTPRPPGGGIAARFGGGGTTPRPPPGGGRTVDAPPLLLLLLLLLLPPFGVIAKLILSTNLLITRISEAMRMNGEEEGILYLPGEDTFV